MTEYQIKLFSPTDRLAEVYVLGATCDACALTRALILTQTHPEFGRAEVTQDSRLVEPEIKALSLIN